MFLEGQVRILGGNYWGEEEEEEEEEENVQY